MYVTNETECPNIKRPSPNNGQRSLFAIAIDASHTMMSSILSIQSEILQRAFKSQQLYTARQKID